MNSLAILCKPWRSNQPPKKILAIRFQALGDLMITLPYLQSLKEKMPHAQIDLLTRDEVSEIPKNLTLFENVILIGGGRNAKIQFILSLLMMPYLWRQHYDVVIDLQNHKISRIIRKLIKAKAWSEFDRTSKSFAGERTRLTIDCLQMGQTKISINLKLRREPSVREKLISNGWDGERNLVILNPAGAFCSRQWPIENYIKFSKLWFNQYPSSQFLILGLNSMKSRATAIKKELTSNLIDLTGSTSSVEAFAIIKLSTLMVTEDSGLMHMAWVQGVPTIALFGSSPSYWSSPLGLWSRCLNSSDLPCGDCFAEECKFGDVHCLTRYEPQRIVDEAESLLKSIPKLDKRVG